MRKLIAGAAMAAAVVGGAHTAEVAGAQSADICTPVYDETLRGDRSQLLLDQIGIYATHGVEVHVQILEDGHDDGIRNPDDAEDFAEELADRCDWIDPDRVNIVVSLEPRAYDIHRTNQADVDITDRDVANATDEFIGNLRDDSRSYQQDVAELLQDINPYEQPQQSENSPSRTAGAEGEDKPFEMPSIPYRNIGIGALVLSALGAAGARIKRGISIRSARNSADDTAGAAMGTALTVQIDADRLLGIIPRDDALDSRQIRGKLDGALVSMSTGKTELADTYEAQKRRLWPSLDAVESQAGSLRKTSAGAVQAATNLDEEIHTLQERMGNIDEIVAAFGETIDTLETILSQLEGEGWDLSTYRERLGTYRTQQAEIIALRQKNYIDRPADMADAIDDSVEQDTTAAANLPMRLAANEQTQTEQAAQLEATQTAVDSAIQTLARLRNDYDASCTKGIEMHDERLLELMRASVERHNKTTTTIAHKSSAAVEEVEETQANIVDLLARVDKHLKSVNGRAELLAELEAQLPSTFEGLAEDARDGITFARSNYGNDVESETYSELEAMEQEVGRARQGLDGTKPKLLELKATADKLDAEQGRLDDRARDEYREMQDLRAQSESLHGDAHDLLRSLESFASTESDVTSHTKAAIRNLSVGQFDTSLNRQGLRDQVANLEARKAAIRRVKQDAEADVERAEAERRRRREEEERRRRRQREEDEARRRRNNSSSSFGGGFGAGSSFGGGGGGRSSHSSGSW